MLRQDHVAVHVEGHSRLVAFAAQPDLARRCAAAPAARGRPPSWPLIREARAFVALRRAPTRAATPTISTFRLPLSEQRATRTRASGRLAGCAFSTLLIRLEWRAPPSRGSRLQRRRAIPVRRRSRRRSLRFRGRSDRALSFDTRLSQDATASRPASFFV